MTEGIAKLQSLPPDIQKIVKAAQALVKTDKAASDITEQDRSAVYSDDIADVWSFANELLEREDAEDIATKELEGALIEARLEWWRR